MNKEQIAIWAAFHQVVAHLREHCEKWVNDAADDSAHHDDYDGLTQDDVYVWFIESF